MSKTEQIKLIREKCIEANPEIVELKFGCEFIEDTATRKQIITGTLAKDPDDFKAITESGRTLATFSKDYLFLNCKIIGRPIRLADVLLAIEKIRKEGTPVLRVYSDGELVLSNDLDSQNRVFWNFKDDNFENQSEETIEFIYKLLK